MYHLIGFNRYKTLNENQIKRETADFQKRFKKIGELPKTTAHYKSDIIGPTGIAGSWLITLRDGTLETKYCFYQPLNPTDKKTWRNLGEIPGVKLQNAFKLAERKFLDSHSSLLEKSPELRLLLNQIYIYQNPKKEAWLGFYTYSLPKFTQTMSGQIMKPFSNSDIYILTGLKIV